MFEFIKQVKKKLKPRGEYILGLLLKEEEGTALLLKNNESGKYHIFDEISFTYTNAWERLVNDVDEVLFRLEQRHKIHVDKVIFFLFSHFADHNGSVKKPYLTHLKEVVKTNEFEVLGFIELHEALSAYLFYKEQTALTAVIIEIDLPAISVFVYKGGELVFNISVAKTSDLVSDIKQAFEQLPKGTMLPPRIILYNSSSLEDECSSLVTHHFSDDLFIQIPKVDIFLPDELYRALVFTFQSQSENTTTFISDPNSTEQEEGGAELFDFVIGKDIAQMQTSQIKPSPVEDIDQQMDDDSQASTAQEKLPDEVSFDQDLKETSKLAMPSFLILWRKTIVQFFTRHKGAKIPIVLFIGVALIGFAIFAVLYFLHTATLTLYYKSDRIEKEIQVSDRDITLKASKKNLAEKAAIQTTGEAEVGEKATGQVVVYNADEQEKTFSKDTPLTSQDSKKFLLESDVKIASASKQLTNEGNLLTITGKSKGSAIAEKIGEEYNVIKNTRFSVADFSQNLYYAIAQSAFTGGKKRKVQTVSRDDLSVARKEVEKKMTQKQQKELASGVKGTKLISPLTEFVVQSESFSSDVGEEAKTLSLTSKATIQYYTYREKEMKEILKKALEKSIPRGYTLDGVDITYRILDADKQKNKIIITVKSVLRPHYDIDEGELFNKIKGKSTSQVKSIIQSDYKVQGFKIDVESGIPFLNTIIPYFDKNITVLIRPL